MQQKKFHCWFDDYVMRCIPLWAGTSDSRPSKESMAEGKSSQLWFAWPSLLTTLLICSAAATAATAADAAADGDEEEDEDDGGDDKDDDDSFDDTITTIS